MAERDNNPDLNQLLRTWADRGRTGLQKAAKAARERLTLRQLRADRDRMYTKLGKEALRLVEGGEVVHPGLARGVERIKEVERKIQEAEDALRARGLEPEPDAGPAEEGVPPTDPNE